MSSFFVTGGTMKPDAPSYVHRVADDELYNALLAGEYCSVLTTRQMGKSSLMARTAVRLRAEGIHCAIVDLQGKGHRKSPPEEWYKSVIKEIADGLTLSSGWIDWWSEQEGLLPSKRMTDFFADVVLREISERVVVFIDEVDWMIRLPFSDEFFAAVRSCYNRRATDSKFDRLSIVLLGSAAPAQLIKDPTRTPFNIGRGIELTDFTLDEATILARPLGENGEAILARILYWTDGHPYLTQMLLAKAAEQNIENNNTDKLVDTIVQQELLTSHARQRENNLKFVGDRLTQGKRKVLLVYRSILRGKLVQDVPTSAVHTSLRLAGVVKPSAERKLEVRNRVYARVFDEKWVKQAMPIDGRIFIAGSVTVVFMAIVLTWLFGRTGPQQVEKLLGQAYSENRTLELRVWNAPYGQLKNERGPNTTVALLQAQASVAKQLQTKSEDPIWLDLSGRADLLDGKYEAALNSLKKALEIQPDSVPVLTDLATAHFEAAENADQLQEYGTAIELLGKALNKNPDNPVALYNRALISEKMFLYQQAINDWQHYLQIDRSGEWAQEASQHLNSLQKKLVDHERSINEPLLQSRNFVEDSGVSPKAQLGDLLDNKVEEYVGRAIREWLPVAFPPLARSGEALKSNGGYAHSSQYPDRSSSQESHAALEALKILSSVLITKHDDHWLSDLMGATQSTRFPAAIRALQQAVSANAAGNFIAAVRNSDEAARLFRQARNVAGELRARVEDIYATERLFQGTHCLAVASQMQNALRYRQYPWIQGQLYLEESNCWLQIGDFDRAHRYLENALTSVEKSQYPILQLRAVGRAATLHFELGDLGGAHSLDRSGLTRYWEGSFSPIRAYQFYSDLCAMAQEKKEWSFALALGKEAITASTSAGQSLTEALAHYRVAQIAQMQDDRTLAKREFDQAKRLFVALSPTQVTRTYQADAEVQSAKLQAALGDTKDALARLLAVRSHIPQISDYSIALNYYKTLAYLQRLNQNANEAVRALHSAINLAEMRLASVRKEDERLQWARETKEIYRDLAESEWRSGNIEGALQIWELYRGATVRGRPELHWAYSNHAESRLLLKSSRFLREIRGLSGQTILSYLQVSGGLIVWLFDDHGIVSKWIEIRQQDFDRLAGQFRDECMNPSSNLASLRQHARSLYDLLIAPIAHHISSDRILVVEPDDSAADIPMAALVDTAGRYLGESYTIVISPGVLYQRQLRHSQPVSTKDRALVVEPARDSRQDFPRFHNDKEARYIALRFPSTVLVKGDYATLANVLRELTRAAIFHYSGPSITVHGEVNLPFAGLKRDSFGFLLLDTPSLTKQLGGLKLAVFSVCLTAGEGEGSLATPSESVRLFLRAGVPDVIASHWNVDSAVTFDFMRTFYDQLLEGKPVPASVRAAASQLRSSPATFHPYYWAAFTAFGK